MARGRRNELVGGLIAVSLIACSSTSSPSATTNVAAASLSPPSSARASAQRGDELSVEIRNRDTVRYQIAWAQDVDRIAWVVEPASFGHIEVASAQDGTLLLTDDCNFVGTWEVGPGSYTIAVDDGVATLEPIAAIGSSVLLAAGEPCPNEGP